MDLNNMKMTDKTSNTLFYSGLILLTIGALGMTFAVFVIIIGLPIFIIGTILTLASNSKSWKQRLFPILFFIVGILVFWPIWNWSQKAEPETFLIPQEFSGKVHILFNEPCGREIEYENGRRLFKIPNNGILTTKFKDQYGIIDQEYYLINENGERSLLPKIDVGAFNEEWSTVKNPNEPSKNKLGVFHWGRIGSDKKNNSKDYLFQEFYISTYSDLTKKFDFEYEQKFDSLEYEILKKCRE
jgi:hypothetical protein